MLIMSFLEVINLCLEWALLSFKRGMRQEAAMVVVECRKERRELFRFPPSRYLPGVEDGPRGRAEADGFMCDASVLVRTTGETGRGLGEGVRVSMVEEDDGYDNAHT